MTRTSTWPLRTMSTASRPFDGLGHDREIDLLGEELAQAGANDGVVVDDGDSDHGSSTSAGCVISRWGKFRGMAGR